MIFLIRDKDIRKRCADAVMQIRSEPLMCVEIKPYDKVRTNLQNKYYWSVMKEIEKHTGTDDKELHAFFKNKFLYKEPVRVFGEFVQVEVTTTNLSTKDFTEYMERITIFCAQNIDFIVPPPNY